VGILNLVGIVSIILTEQRSAPGVVGPSFAYHNLASSNYLTIPFGTTTQNPPRKINYHKGINETLLWLEKVGVRVPVDYPRLPPWWWIETQYGEEPRILGLDRCEHFRTHNRGGGRLDDVVIAPAGLFNSGTNLLSSNVGSQLLLSTKIRIYQSSGTCLPTTMGETHATRIPRESYH
jgi:hypothetical protein